MALWSNDRGVPKGGKRTNRIGTERGTGVEIEGELPPATDEAGDGVSGLPDQAQWQCLGASGKEATGEEMAGDRAVAGGGGMTEAAAQRRMMAMVAFAKVAEREKIMDSLFSGHGYRAPTGSTGVAVGTTPRRMRDRRIATGTRPATATTTSASASPLTQSWMTRSASRCRTEPAVVRLRVSETGVVKPRPYGAGERAWSSHAPTGPRGAGVVKPRPCGAGERAWSSHAPTGPGSGRGQATPLPGPGNGRGQATPLRGRGERNTASADSDEIRKGTGRCE